MEHAPSACRRLPIATRLTPAEAQQVPDLIEAHPEDAILYLVTPRHRHVLVAALGGCEDHHVVLDQQGADVFLPTGRLAGVVVGRPQMALVGAVAGKDRTHL